MNTIKQKFLAHAKGISDFKEVPMFVQIKGMLWDLALEIVYTHHPYKEFSGTSEILEAFSGIIQSGLLVDHPQKELFSNPKYLKMLSKVIKENSLNWDLEDYEASDFEFLEMHEAWAQNQCPDEKNISDPEFLELLSDIIQGATHVHRPENLNFIRIDNWFGSRWLGFSGKALGAVGVWYPDLVIPPFVPNRIESISSFAWNKKDQDYNPVGQVPGMHTGHPSSDNFRNKLKTKWPDSTFFWYSANTKKNGRGCLMAYVSGTDGHWPWYLGFEKTTEWKIKETKGISLHQIQTFQESATENSEALKEIPK